MRSAAFVRSCCAFLVRWFAADGSLGMVFRSIFQPNLTRGLPPLLSILAIPRTFFFHSPWGLEEAFGTLPNRNHPGATAVPNVKNIINLPLKDCSLLDETHSPISDYDCCRENGPEDGRRGIPPRFLKMWHGRSYIRPESIHLERGKPGGNLGEEVPVQSCGCRGASRPA